MTSVERTNGLHCHTLPMGQLSLVTILYVSMSQTIYQNPSLYFWTRVGEKLFENTKFQIDYDVVQKHFNGQIMDEGFVNDIVEPQELVSGKQAELLESAFTLSANGPAEVHVSTGSGGSSSVLPWREQKNKLSNQRKNR